MSFKKTFEAAGRALNSQGYELDTSSKPYDYRPTMTVRQGDGSSEKIMTKALPIKDTDAVVVIIGIKVPGMAPMYDPYVTLGDKSMRMGLTYANKIDFSKLLG